MNNIPPGYSSFIEPVTNRDRGSYVQRTNYQPYKPGKIMDQDEKDKLYEQWCDRMGVDTEGDL